MDLKYIFVLYTFIGFVTGSYDKLTQIAFVVDFIKAQDSPKTVLDYLCWEKDDKFELQKQFTTNGFRYRPISKKDLIFKNFYNPYFFTILVDIDCDFNGLLNNALETTLVKHPNVWILFGPIEKIQSSDCYIPVNSFFVVPVYNELMNVTEVKTIYKINKNNRWYIEKTMGYWSYSRGIYDFENINLIKLRNNFQRMPLRVTYVITDKGTLEHFKDYRDKHLDNLTKINYVLYDFICDLLNATHKFLIANDWGFESKNRSSPFSPGLFQDLTYDRSDVAGTVSFTPASRLRYFKYVFAPIKDFSVHFVFRAPSLAYYTNLFALPFDTTVWVTTGLLVIFCSVIINIILTWEIKERSFIYELKENRENPPTFLDVIMMQIAIMCQMDFFYEPRSISGKMATFVVLISFTFIYTAFSARIVLLLQSSTNKIHNLDTLYAANFDFGVENQLYNKFYFETPSPRSNEYWRRIIYENKIKRPGGDRFLDAAKGMLLVRDTYFAFHVEQTVANYLIDRTFSNKQKCSLQVVETIYKADVPYLAAPRNSSYIEFFVASFRRLAETGVHNREYRRCFTKKPSCQGRANTFVSVGLIELYFPFVVFGVGICLSLVILLLEIVSFSRLKIHCAL